jgi:hypothetical protein
MALVGYELEMTKIEERIQEIRAQLNGAGSKSSLTDGQPKRRKFSAATRKRMAAAQKKRWAALRKTK